VNNFTEKHALNFSALSLPHAKRSLLSRYFFIALSIIYFISVPCQGDSFTAKRAGQGFTAITQDFTSSLSNPALLTKYTKEDDVFVSFNLGGMGSDQYNIVDISEAIAQELNSLANDINNNIANGDYEQRAKRITEGLASIDKDVVNVRNGINFQLIIPNKYLSAGIFTNQFGRIGGATVYDKADDELLERSIAQGNLDLSQLKSTANGIGYSIAETGVMLGYQAINHANYELSIGSKVKYQRIDLFYNKLNISEFDDDKFDLNNEEYLTSDSDVNVDLGLYLNWGDTRQWHLGIVADNLLSRNVQHSENSVNFTLEEAATIGFSYHNNWLRLATEIDLIDREHFASLAASKYAAIGAEFTVTDTLQLRLGLRSDLNDVDGDLYTLGLGVSPWDILFIDLAAFAGNNDTYGAALQLGLKI